MGNHKVLSSKDNDNFIKTVSFIKLCKKLRNLKTSRGHFILVLGKPGIGKSANIYQSLQLIDLNVYDAFLFIDKDSKSSEVFKLVFDTLKEDMDGKSKEDIYQKAANYDLILFADSFMDSEYLNNEKVGLGLWTEEHGPSTAPFYFKVFYEYLKHRNELKKINIVAQTSWVFKFRGVRYDLLTDFSFLSKFLRFLLKQIFEIVLISYSNSEMKQIIKNHPKSGSDEEIEKLIKKYGNQIRLIFDELDQKR